MARDLPLGSPVSASARRFSSPGWPGRGLPYLFWFIAYVLLGSLVLFLPPAHEPCWYPPVALGFALLWARGGRIWPLLFLADFCVSALQYPGKPIEWVIVASATVTEASLAVLLVRQLGFRGRFERPYEVCALLAGALAATFSGSFAGCLLLNVLGQPLPPDFAHFWLAWWLGDGSAMLVWIPFWLLWWNPRAVLTRALSDVRPRYAVEELGLLALAAAALSWSIFDIRFPLFDSGAWYLCFLPICWAAIRFGRLGTSAILPVIGFTSVSLFQFLWVPRPGMPVVSTHHAHTPFAIQLFQIVLVLASLTLAVSLDGEREAVAEQRRLAGDLGQVARRLRRAQRVARVGTWEMNAESGGFTISESLGELLNLADVAAAGRDVFESAIAEEDREPWRGAVAEARVKQEPWEIEYRVQGPKGLLYFRESGDIVPGRDSEPAQLVATVQDITRGRHAEVEARSSEERFKALAKATTDAIWSWDIATGAIWWSQGLEALFGAWPSRPDEHIDVWAERVHPEDREKTLEGLQATFASLENEWSANYRFARADGSYAQVLDRGVVMRGPKGEAVHMIGGVTDLTAQLRVQEELRRSEERFALAARGANDGLWDWDMREGAIFFSERWNELIGRAGEHSGRLDDWLDLVHPEDRYDFEQTLMFHVEGRLPKFQVEYRMRHSDGSYRWMLTRGLAVRDEGGSPYRMAGSQSDTTRRKVYEEQLRLNAFFDGLTGLPNRALFLDRLRMALLQLERDQSLFFAVLFLDLDRFKTINDSLGHAAGDQLLVEVSSRIRNCLRLEDTAARIGGDEFAVLIASAHSVSDVTVIADRLQASLLKPYRVGSYDTVTSASIGIATISDRHEKPEDLLRDADAAMYRAKLRGKACYALFDEGMHTLALDRLRLEMDIRRALDRREFFLVFQPIISMDTARVWGFEALIRWRHPVRGLVSPIDFIPVAEETGEILKIGMWVMAEACRSLRVWRENHPGCGDLTISVNLSARQFNQVDLVDQIHEIVDSIGVDPRCVKLEITESLIMQNPEETSFVLHRLKALGFDIHMDDFGTGYSSLSYLHRFPIDALKIDQSFVSRVGGNTPDSDTAPSNGERNGGPLHPARGGAMRDSDRRAEDYEIVQTICSLAGGLGMKTIGEGIETAAQRDFLKAAGCGLGQGYFFSRPLDFQAVGALLRQNSSHDSDLP